MKRFLLVALTALLSFNTMAAKKSLVLCNTPLSKKPSGVFLTVSEYSKCDHILTLSDTSYKVESFILELIPDNSNIQTVKLLIEGNAILETLNSFICSQVGTLHFSNVIATCNSGKKIRIKSAYIGMKLH